MEEIWSGVIYQGIDLSEYYEVSTYGRLRNAKTKHIETPNISSIGYLAYTGSLGSRIFQKRIKIHRAVAETFIPNPSEKPFVNHIDGDKTNNHVSNLEWVTAQENTIHAYKTGLISIQNQRSSHAKLFKPVIRISSDGTQKRYDSVRSAARDVSLSQDTVSGTAQHISLCCRGMRKTCFGYTWQYA